MDEESSFEETLVQVRSQKRSGTGKVKQTRLRETLYKLTQIQGIPLRKIMCSNSAILSLYEPIAKITVPQAFGECPSAFNLLCSQSMCDCMTQFFHTLKADFSCVPFHQLFDLLEFSKELNNTRLKICVGNEIAQRLQIEEMSLLADGIKYTHSKGFYASARWIAFHFTHRRPTVDTLTKLCLPLEVERIAMSGWEDTHVKDIFPEGSERKRVRKKIQNIHFFFEKLNFKFPRE